MMDEALLKKAHDRVYKDIAESKKYKATPKPRSLTEVAEERLEEKKLEAVAPSWGYPDLDQILKGVIPGRLYILTGDENVGKTSLSCNFVVRCAKQGRKALYFALEPENTVIDYIHSVRLDKRFDELTAADLAYDDGNIHVFGKQEVSKVEDLAEIIEQLDRYDMVVIDHIGYFVKDKQNSNQEQSNILKILAGLAKKKQCAIIVVAHMRKRAPGQRKDRVPTSDDIAGSASFKQDGTDVMIVVRKLKDPKADGLEYSNEGVLYVTKTKSGPNGNIFLQFQDRKANIMSVGEIMVLAQKESYERGEYVKVTADKLVTPSGDIKW